MNKNASALATKYSVGTFKNLETGEWLPGMEHQVPWLLDTDNKCRGHGVPFRTFLTFTKGCAMHQEMVNMAKSGENPYSKVNCPIQMF